MYLELRYYFGMSRKLVVKEVYCKSVLSRSRIYGVDYSINPYLGCMHGCVYCYARFMVKELPEKLEWGSFVYPKVNAPTVLSRELKKSKPGVVLLSSVTDPYQLIESRYMVTRRILAVLLKANYPLVVLTKSDLVLRDLDLIKRFDEVDVGLTLTSLDEEVRRVFEPNAPSVIRRINALKVLVKNNVRTYAFLGPLIPLISERTIEKLIEKLAQINVDYIIADKLNIKSENWRTIVSAIRKYYPNIAGRIENIIFKDYVNYYEVLRSKIRSLARKFNLEVEFCY